jgi:tRNA-dihydrouridine synthase A
VLYIALRNRAHLIAARLLRSLRRSNRIPEWAKENYASKQDMTKSAEKPGVQADSLYSRKPVFAVAPMIDFTH